MVRRRPDAGSCPFPRPSSLDNPYDVPVERRAGPDRALRALAATAAAAGAAIAMSGTAAADTADPAPDPTTPDTGVTVDTGPALDTGSAFEPGPAFGTGPAFDTGPMLGPVPALDTGVTSVTGATGSVPALDPAVEGDPDGGPAGPLVAGDGPSVDPDVPDEDPADEVAYPAHVHVEAPATAVVVPDVAPTTAPATVPDPSTPPGDATPAPEISPGEPDRAGPGDAAPTLPGPEAEPVPDPGPGSAAEVSPPLHEVTGTDPGTLDVVEAVTTGPVGVADGATSRQLDALLGPDATPVGGTGADDPADPGADGPVGSGADGTVGSGADGTAGTSLGAATATALDADLIPGNGADAGDPGTAAPIGTEGAGGAAAGTSVDDPAGDPGTAAADGTAGAVLGAGGAVAAASDDGPAEDGEPGSGTLGDRPTAASGGAAPDALLSERDTGAGRVGPDAAPRTDRTTSPSPGTDPGTGQDPVTGADPLSPGLVTAGAAGASGLAAQWLERTLQQAPEVAAGRVAKGGAAAGLDTSLTPRQERALSALNREPVATLRSAGEFAATMSDVGDRVTRAVGSEVGYGLVNLGLTTAAAPLGPVGAVSAAGTAKLVQKEQIDPFLARVLADPPASDVLAGPDGAPYRPGDGRPELVDPLGERITSTPIDDMLTAVDGRPLTADAPLLVRPDGQPLTEPNALERFGRGFSALAGGSPLRGPDGGSLPSSPAVLGPDGSPVPRMAEGSVLRPTTTVRDTALQEFLDGTAQQERAARAELGIPEAGDLTTAVPADVDPAAVQRAAVEATRDTAGARRAAGGITGTPEELASTRFTPTAGTATPEPGPSARSRAAAIGEAAKAGTRTGLTALGVPGGASDAVGALLNACIGAACTGVGKVVEGLVNGTTPSASSLADAAVADATGQLARAALTLSPDELLDLAALTGAGHLAQNVTLPPVTGGSAAPRPGSPPQTGTTPQVVDAPRPVDTPSPIDSAAPSGDPGLAGTGAGTRWEDLWPLVGTGEEPTVVLRPSTRVEMLTPTPAQAGLLDHLAGPEGAAALDALRRSEYAITSDDDWYRAVGDVAAQLRMAAIPSPPVTEQRRKELFPVPDEADLAGLPPAVQGPLRQYGEANAEAQRRLAGGGATGLTAPEMSCWLVQCPDGTARVLPEIAVGNERSVDWTKGMDIGDLEHVVRADGIHLHPFTYGETAGLSTNDLEAAQGVARWLKVWGSAEVPPEVAIVSIDLPTGTIVRGVPDLETDEWKLVQPLPGGPGPATDQLSMGGTGHSTRSPRFEKPLPLEIVREGTSDAVFGEVGAILTPSSADLAAQQREQAAATRFDARLASPEMPTASARPGTGAADAPPRPGAGTADAPRPGAGVGAVVASVAAPLVEQGLRQAGVLPTDPLQQGWWPQTLNVGARAATGCLTGLGSRADCLTGALTEGTNAFFDQTTLGVQARRFAETEYDGDPVRERLEAAASVPINTARQVGTLGKVVGSAFETTGQTIGTGLAYGLDLLDDSYAMPPEDYLAELDGMSGPQATRAALEDARTTRERIDRRTLQVLTGVPSPDDPGPSASPPAPDAPGCASDGDCAVAGAAGAPPAGGTGPVRNVQTSFLQSWPAAADQPGTAAAPPALRAPEPPARDLAGITLDEDVSVPEAIVPVAVQQGAVVPSPALRAAEPPVRDLADITLDEDVSVPGAVITVADATGTITPGPTTAAGDGVVELDDGFEVIATGEPRPGWQQRLADTAAGALDQLRRAETASGERLNQVPRSAVPLDGGIAGVPLLGGAPTTFRVTTLRGDVGTYRLGDDGVPRLVEAVEGNPPAEFSRTAWELRPHGAPIVPGAAPSLVPVLAVP